MVSSHYFSGEEILGSIWHTYKHIGFTCPVTTNIYRAVFFLDSEVPGKVYLSLATGLCQRLLDNCHQRISPEAEQFQISPGEVLKALFISLSH